MNPVESLKKRVALLLLASCAAGSASFAEDRSPSLEGGVAGLATVTVGSLALFKGVEGAADLSGDTALAKQLELEIAKARLRPVQLIEAHPAYQSLAADNSETRALKQHQFENIARNGKYMPEKLFSAGELQRKPVILSAAELRAATELHPQVRALDEATAALVRKSQLLNKKWGRILNGGAAGVIALSAGVTYGVGAHVSDANKKAAEKAGVLVDPQDQTASGASASRAE